MIKLQTDEFISYLPELFQINLRNNEGRNEIFKKLKNIFYFDYAAIFYLNPETVQLKFSYSNQELIETTYKLNKNDMNELYSKDGIILDEKASIIKSLKFIGYKSYIIQKLAVGDTVYGFILLADKKINIYETADLNILKTACSILSYVIKDLELSNVFKIQLNALKNGLIERNDAYKTIKEQNEKIKEADKVKNEFLANISHELRTPLNAILGFSEILSTGLHGKLNEKQKEYISDIHVSGLHLLSMVNEILDISKIEAKAVKIVRSDFNIYTALKEVANILKPLATKKNVKIIIDCENDFLVFADYQKIQQILYNLVNNAIKYSPNNNEVEISARKKAKSFELKVHDNGIGIDKKYHGKIFAKFVQLDNAYTKKESSTGLGLTITKELTELHGGKISVKSEINNGSTFIVEIPLFKRNK